MRANRNNQSSEYRGVTLDRDRNIYRARLEVDGKKYHLGWFQTEEEARDKYEEAHSTYLKTGVIIRPATLPKKQPPGVIYDKRKNVYRARIRRGGDQIWLGTCQSPQEAHRLYLEAKESYEKHGFVRRSQIMKVDNHRSLRKQFYLTVQDSTATYPDQELTENEILRPETMPA